MKSKKERITKKITGTYSTEQIYHFNCAVCKKWWSIADIKKPKTLFCPWCGKKQVMLKLKNTK
ncbi:hypothetical protein A3J61_00705 [Candidatus Nomurabacteria bacterium RIFCSPHIGHO2_02_FULL_38_15]|uniref:Uncharacterized protein n=1 Tax=Candidatus Nomurabacteria bacterium RIFCSPHIGHO2_02_FULL_38_15 TaxID=1801752 RepID=A0A1F6VR52_9BACT|nr:MAG: hypothetical protein A3J61_00705 [Candidatus Nomurabacteria bacterium RIFCSPHIGHO2_02_FULL_38_15]